MEFIVHNIWYIIIGLFLILGLGGGLLIYTGYIHRIIDWIRPDSDKYVRAKVFCEDKNIRDRRLKIGRYCILDSKKCRAFYLVHDLLLTKFNSSMQFLALTERGSIPIDFQGIFTKEKFAKYPSAQKVFIDTTADIRSQASKESAKNAMGMSLAIIAMAGALVFIVMAIIMFWKGQNG